MRQRITTHQELDVYQMAFATAMRIFELSRTFPKHEKYSLTDQVLRASRSVCANLAEAFRKRRYPAAFVSKLTDAEGEAAETQVWLEFAAACKYLDKQQDEDLNKILDHILGKLVNMINHPEDWAL